MGKKTPNTPLCLNHVAFSVQNVCSYLHPILCVCDCTYVGVCRFLEEYLDSKRPLSPVSPLSDSPESTKPLAKTNTSEQHYLHVHKNRDSSIKVIQKSAYLDHPNTNAFLFLSFISPLFDLHTQPKTEVECVKVSRHPQLPSESWGPAGHRGAVPNHET